MPDGAARPTDALVQEGAALDARILIVDDEEANVDLLEQLLARAGYRNLAGVTDSRRALPAFREQPADLVLLDLLMPHLDGYAVLAQLREEAGAESYLPIVVLTADVTAAAKQRALAAGATDFLTKPFDHVELALRVRNLLETRGLYQRLSRQYQMLDELYRRAREAASLREQAQSAISHDLGHPLAVIRVMNRLLRRQAERGAAVASAEVLERAGAIDEAATGMLEMLGELLDLARLQSGRPLELEVAPLDLVALVREVAATQQAAAGGRIRLAAEAPALPGEWDGPRLRRVVNNLLSNAIKYSPNGGAIAVTLRREDGEQPLAVLSVADRGIGIPARDLPRVFEPFQRAGNVAGRYPGTGLGLAGARQVIEQHGGTVTIESVEGAGATVTVRLPLVI